MASNDDYAQSSALPQKRRVIDSELAADRKRALGLAGWPGRPGRPWSARPSPGFH